MNEMVSPPPHPIGMLAELTHRCPLRCPYCSNPLEMDRRSSEIDTQAWKRVFEEAAALGVLHIHLSGGEPPLRHDLVDLVAHCAKLGLYTNLITSGVGVTRARLEALSEAGLDHVQLSVQAAEAKTADHIGGFAKGHGQKIAFAAWVVELGLPLTINAVIHRGNIAQVGDMIELALTLGAKRIEIAHAQYYGWAQLNRAALIPSREQADASLALVADARERLKGRLVIDLVLPDYYSDYPKPCTGGWGRRTFNVTPAGKVMPCHAAATIPNLQFWSVHDHSLADIWWHSPAFNAFRGTSWMPEPCRSCDRKERDWGGCRCQALALTGDAAATDPACHKSPFHQRMRDLATQASVPGQDLSYHYRSFAGVSEKTDGAVS